MFIEQNKEGGKWCKKPLRIEYRNIYGTLTHKIQPIAIIKFSVGDKNKQIDLI